MKKNHWITLCLLLVFGFTALALRPVPVPTEKDCLVVKGRVVDIHEGGVKDVVFKLAGDNKSYYVNRGLERGLNLDSLESALMNRDVLIKYPDHWTPLDPDNSSVHISKIEHEGETIFSELKR